MSVFVKNGLPLPRPLPLFATNKRKQWIEFKEDFLDYATSNEIFKETPEIQIAHLRTALGPQCRSKLRALKVDVPELTAAEITARQTSCRISKELEIRLEAFGKDYCGKQNIVILRERFYSCNQGSLDIDRFIERVMELAEDCDFPAEAKEQLIRDRLVLGVENTNLKEKLLQSEKTELQNVVDLMRRAAMSSTQAGVAKNPVSSTAEPVSDTEGSVNKVYNTRDRSNRNARPAWKGKSGRTSSRKCKFCDRDHTPQKKYCPARDQQCSKCKRFGHFAVCCTKVRDCRRVVDESSAEESDSEDEAFSMSVQRPINSKKRRVMANLELEHKGRKRDLRVQVDSGASVNILPMDTYQELRQHKAISKMKNSSVRLRMYSGDVTRSLGECTAWAINGEKRLKVTFQLVNLQEQPLLSAVTSIELGLIKLGENAEFVNSVQPSSGERKELQEIVNEYEDVFKGLGRLPGEVKIHLRADAIPVQCPPRKVPVALKDQIIQRVRQLQQQKVIEPVSGPTEWISQMLVVARKGKKLRVTLDPYHLNKAAKRSHYPLPVLSDVLPRLARAKYFSVADASDGFFQCVLEDSSTDLTTFWTPIGRYKYLRMPQGLSISPEIYQAKQMEALENLKGVEVIADDILIHGETYEEHNENLKEFFKRCRKKNLKLNRAKLRLGVSQVKYMGHILTREGFRADPEKIDIIRKTAPPADKKALLRILGSTNYLSKFIPSYSEIAAPLRTLLKENVEFAWMPEHQTSFDKLKECLSKSPVLAYFDPKLPIQIQTDASNNAVGGVLLQGGRPVDLCSAALRPSELKYAVIEKELLAILISCRKFEHQIFAHPAVIVETDHQPLISIFKKPLHSAPKRLQRMLLYLQKYNFELRYVKGKQNLIADWLSRDTYRTTHDCPNEDSLVFRTELENLDVTALTPIKNSTLDRIANSTLRDPQAQTLQKLIKNGWPADKRKCPADVVPYWKYKAELTSDKDIIFKGEAVFIPRELRREMLTLAHASHYSFSASWKRTKHCIFWPTVKAELKEFCETCHTCLALLPKQAKEPIHPGPVATYPFQIVYQDIFTWKNRQFLVTVDAYSDYFEVDDLGHSATTARVVAASERHFARYGSPVELHSDNGPQFISNEYREFLNQWGVTLVTSSPYYPQGNGKAEAAVKVAKRLLKKCNLNQENYQYALLELRNTIQSDDSSRAQKFFYRQLRCRLPSIVDQNFVANDQQVQANILKKKKQKENFDKSARELKPLRSGDEVRVQPIRKQDLCVPATCLTLVGPRSYLVRLQDGTVIRRNRRHLTLVREAASRTDTDQSTMEATENQGTGQDISMQSLTEDNSSEMSRMEIDTSMQGGRDVDISMRSCREADTSSETRMQTNSREEQSSSRPSTPKQRTPPSRKRKRAAHLLSTTIRRSERIKKRRIPSDR